MTVKSLGWWGGVFLSVVVVQAGAQSAGGGAIAATDGGKVHALAPLVVQGQKLETELPEGSTVITRQQMDDRAIESWEDFSKRGEPGVNVNTQNNSINIRGMDGDRVVTRVDGIRLPWLDDGSRSAEGGLETIPFNSLSAIDLVRGPGSAQSGSLIGYLDLRTLSPGDLLAPGKDFGALLKSGYNSADNSFGGDAALAGRFGAGTRWLVQAGERKGHELKNMGEQGGYGPDREKANPADYTQKNMLIKLEQDLGAGHMLSLSGEVFRKTTDIDNMREQGTGTRYYEGQNTSHNKRDRDRVVLGYSYQSTANRAALAHGDLKLYWQKLELEEGMDAVRTPGSAAGAYGRRNSIEESTVGLVTEWGGYFDGAVRQHWSIGGEWAGNDTEQLSRGYDSCPAAGCSHLRTNQADMPKVKGNTWAAWVQDEFSWGNGRFALTPALRFDSYQQKPQSGGWYSKNLNSSKPLAENSDSKLSPSLLGRYTPKEGLSFYGRYGYGFKAPNTSQLYLSFGGKSAGEYIVLGNPDLKPETSHGWELGVDVGDQERGGRLSVYDTRYKNYIDRVIYAKGAAGRDPSWDVDGYNTVYYYTNRARVRIYGAELSGQWAFNSNWYTWGSLAWANGKDQDTDTYLNSVAPLKLILALGYRADQWGAESIVTLAKRRTEVEYPEPTSTQKYADFKAPGYGLLDLTAWWKPQAVKGLRLQAGVYNVFDRKYWNALDVPTPGSSGFANPIDSYTQPGRNFRVSLTYQY
ncbi:MAG TPA: TonB-dependent hemoglobin/transferrin/lactoferrin family receptor [Burkholderiaceae bacterium]|nr:TonB-dependent hemoglobin/transferrin/lactoferrin family receptor [Burkholderiaceae bacterium]